MAQGGRLSALQRKRQISEELLPGQRTSRHAIERLDCCQEGAPPLLPFSSFLVRSYEVCHREAFLMAVPCVVTLEFAGGSGLDGLLGTSLPVTHSCQPRTTAKSVAQRSGGRLLSRRRFTVSVRQMKQIARMPIMVRRAPGARAVDAGWQPDRDGFRGTDLSYPVERLVGSAVVDGRQAQVGRDDRVAVLCARGQ
jgi:hypothetical protein